MASSTSPPCCANCYRNIPAALRAFTARQHQHLALHLSLTRSDAFAASAFAHLPSFTMPLLILIDTLIASPPIPAADKTAAFRPWRNILIELTIADLTAMTPAAYYRMQAQMDLLCHSSVHLSDDGGLYGPDLGKLRALLDEPETQQGFTEEHIVCYADIMNAPRFDMTKMNEALVNARREAEGTAEGSEERDADDEGEITILRCPHVHS